MPRITAPSSPPRLLRGINTSLHCEHGARTVLRLICECVSVACCACPHIPEVLNQRDIKHKHKHTQTHRTGVHTCRTNTLHLASLHCMCSGMWVLRNCTRSVPNTRHRDIVLSGQTELRNVVRRDKSHGLVGVRALLKSRKVHFTQHNAAR